MNIHAIKVKCAEKGLKQCELAKICGVSEGTISNIFTGKRSPRTELLKRLCDALDVKAEEIW